MAKPKSCEKPREELHHALRLIIEALITLDVGGAPADIGAHLDRAKRRLEEVISSQPGS